MKTEKKTFPLNAYRAATEGLHRRQKLPSKCNLYGLVPFFDEESQVGGRLANSPYTIDRRFPVLIPRKSPINEMLIREAHKKNFCEGSQLTLCTLRQTIWLPVGLSAFKVVLYG